MNGTYLDGKMLDPEIFRPLKNGASIYLGPPADAPAAFTFLTNKMSNEDSCEINMNSCNQRNRGQSTHLPSLVSYKNIKRPSDPKDSGTNEDSSPRKKISASSSSPTTTTSSRVQDFFEEIDDNVNLSDCSISSLDSLKTRVRKLSAKKNLSRNSRNKDTMKVASTSASPQLRPSSNVNLESKPSTSGMPAEIWDRKRNKVKKPTISKEFALLNTLFNESESSTSETIKADDDSQSLLNESKILIDCEPYPFSQPLAIESAQTEQDKSNEKIEKKYSVEEQLEKATLEVKKLKKDKLYLSRLVKDLKSEEFLKRKFQVEFQKMLEDELMCNICTEVFLKVQILIGFCCHFFLWLHAYWVPWVPGNSLNFICLAVFFGTEEKTSLCPDSSTTRKRVFVWEYASTDSISELSQ
ncbi:unnamed protein product, partial [Larinioides sclopetarius]